MKAAREAWFESQPDLDPDRLVFLDETWTATSMVSTRGRCPRGQRLRSPVPHGHWKTPTLAWPSVSLWRPDWKDSEW